jgi:hypothetical protein
MKGTSKIARGFRSGPKGRIASAVHHTVGKWVWDSFLRSALAAIEKQTASPSLTPRRTDGTLPIGAQVTPTTPVVAGEMS